MASLIHTIVRLRSSTLALATSHYVTADREHPFRSTGPRGLSSEHHVFSTTNRTARKRFRRIARKPTGEYVRVHAAFATHELDHVGTLLAVSKKHLTVSRALGQPSRLALANVRGIEITHCDAEFARQDRPQAA